MARRTITVKVYGQIDQKLQEKRDRRPAVPLRKPYACALKTTTAATDRDMKAIVKAKNRTVIKLAARGFA